MGERHVAENVKRWRNVRGLSQVEVANTAGISRTAYQKIERGVSVPRVTTLQNIARALDVGMGDLLQPVPELPNVRFRSQKKMTRRENVLAEVALLLENLNELEQITGEKLPYRFKGLAKEFESLEPGRDRALFAARRAREELGLSLDEAIRDIGGLVEAAGVKLLPIRLASPGFFGLSVAPEGKGPAIAVNVWERISVERWVFTTAHELGHLLLHLHTFDGAEAEEHPDEEREANIFASHFLMPEVVFHKEWREARGLPLVARVFKLKRMFHVSYRTVLYRLVESGTYDTGLWPRFNALYRAKTGKSLTGAQEPDGMGPDVFRPSDGFAAEEPENLSESDFVPDRRAALVRDALERNLISLSRAAELLRVDLPTMRHIVTGWEV